MINLRPPTVSVLLALSLLAVALPVASQSPFDPPAPAVVDEARVLVGRMIANARGPYRQIRWFCNDGAVLPPEPFACNEHGGGRQHAQYSDERERLAELGWSVGTIFAALDAETLLDADRRHQRLRELALERYLTDIDDGWVLRQAQNYRGRVQVEGEEATGRAMLLQLLQDGDWLAANFLLGRESTHVIPHSGATEDRTRGVRREATEIANLDSAFERLRVEIHTAPNAGTADRVRAWADERPPEIATLALALASSLDELYGAAGRRFRLEQQRLLLASQSGMATLAAQLEQAESADTGTRFDLLTAWLHDARRAITTASTGARTRLLLFDAGREVENELAVIAADLLASENLSRARLLDIGRRFVDAAFGVGLLTEGEYAAVAEAWPAPAATELALADYRATVELLRRLPQWAVGSVRYSFAEPLVRYTALEPRAASFIDDMLRGSPLTSLAELTRRLSRDLGRLSGVRQQVAAENGAAAFGVNAGVAIGTLRIFETAEALEHGDYGRSDIVLLPETVAELARVAGIVTLGEGNPLSHVQLLARNFGIPNVAVLPETVPLLRPLEGQEIVLAVAGDGSLVLRAAADVDPEIVAQLRPANETASELTVPRPDLSRLQPIRLAELESALSGRVVGPKAANLGQLARLFPGRVAAAVAVPFGIFAAHMDLGTPSLRERLIAAYGGYRGGKFDEAELLARLESIRVDIAALEVLPEHRRAIAEAMAAEFGDDPATGLFLRSDTNVEDLPQFTGAGLSETLPNVVGLERQLAALPRIWASVLSARAIAWRSNLLTNPEEVYASVLLMQSVPSTKSGVMVTADLTGLGDGVTVSTGWGVGGAVAGEAVETLVLRPDGSSSRVTEAKTAYQRNIDPAGGIRWLPAADGPVLSAAEVEQLRELAREVGERYAPVFDDQGRQRPWDIEFGFVDGELTLFQIRPLVERGAQLADRVVARLTADEAVDDAGAVKDPDVSVVLAESPLTESD